MSTNAACLKLPHSSSSTCVSTFSTDIPFDAVPNDVAVFHLQHFLSSPPLQIPHLPHRRDACFHLFLITAYPRVGASPVNRPRQEIKNYNSLRWVAMEKTLRNNSHQQSHLHHLIFPTALCVFPQSRRIHLHG